MLTRPSRQILQFCWTISDRTHQIAHSYTCIPYSLTATSLRFVQTAPHRFHRIIAHSVSFHIACRSALGRMDWGGTCINANKARRQLKKKRKQVLKGHGTKQAFTTYRKARACKKRLVQSTLRKRHRKQIEEGTGDARKTWKLVRWIKNRTTPSRAFTSYLKRRNGIMADTRTAKAECLAESFLPQAPNTNLEDINQTALSRPFLRILHQLCSHS